MSGLQRFSFLLVVSLVAACTQPYATHPSLSLRAEVPSAQTEVLYTIAKSVAAKRRFRYRENAVSGDDGFPVAAYLTRRDVHVVIFNEPDSPGVQIAIYKSNGASAASDTTVSLVGREFQYALAARGISAVIPAA